MHEWNLLSNENNDQVTQESMSVSLRDHSAWNVPGSETPKGCVRRSQVHPRRTVGGGAFCPFLTVTRQEAALCVDRPHSHSQQGLMNGRLHIWKQTPPGCCKCTVSPTRAAVALTAAVSSRCLCLWISHKDRTPWQLRLH